MSNTNNDKAAGHQEYYPPPPPGPPPTHANPLGSNPHYPPTSTAPTTHQEAIPPQHVTPGQKPAQQPSQHPNETPIPDYPIPTYNPSQPPSHYQAPISPSELYGTDDPPTHNAESKPSSWSTRFAGLGSKVSGPFNALANKMGSEAFLPTTMDKECEKAARILRAFCKDGIYSESSVAPAAAPGGPSGHPETSGTAKPPADSKSAAPKKPKVLLTIPSKVIARAQGLAIFTTVRAGFHVSGASGSGILIARKEDGSWSPPSGIQVHSVGAGFVVGLDIYNCVVVINTREALTQFTKTRMSLGSDLSVAAGPWGAGGSVDFGVDTSSKGKDKSRSKERDGKAATGTEQNYPQATTGVNTAPTAELSTPGAAGTSKDRKPSPFRDAISKPVYSYVKSRGLYAGVQVDGTVITERKDANAAFYGEKGITVDKILRGDVKPQSGEGMWPAAARGLLDVLIGAEGWRGREKHGEQHGTSTGHGGYETSGTRGDGYDVHAAGVTEGMRHVDLGSGAGSSAQSHPPPQVHGLSAKEAEAAAEASRARSQRDSMPPPPPAYHEPEAHHGEELPPAYVDDGVARPGVGDVKHH